MVNVRILQVDDVPSLSIVTPLDLFLDHALNELFTACGVRQWDIHTLGHAPFNGLVQIVRAVGRANDQDAGIVTSESVGAV